MDKMEKEKADISVVVVSAKNNEESNKLIEEIHDTCGCNVHVFFLFNPEGMGLTQIYSDFLKREDIQTDVVVFMHDDINFLKKGWGKEMLRLFKDNPEYGIIGVAGSADFDQNGAWWNYKHIYGQVLHRNEGKTWLTTFSPLLDHDLEEVCVIDGLFMGIEKNRITKSFNPDIHGFDFYDIDFCLSNYLDGKTKIGVTTNIRIAHNSIGKLKPTWYVNREIVNKKYGKYFPIALKKQ
jgi:hypothetical protein